eukprot:CAMPEP_0195284752 /NCGR_PEP_ID=MMETSP0707-20130614/2845_1 /TAXON_ID=33640 /ORGANISM="Asterionellopsis glacialis, Strain CCMP134" /LENGTH=208 /DNA_ID=CAMNT_0040344145 /DNA_START=64 /DNA_END=687 /DNA_ORIENTATION=-
MNANGTSSKDSIFPRQDAGINRRFVLGEKHDESEHFSSITESSWAPTDADQDHTSESYQQQSSLRESSSWIPTGSSRSGPCGSKRSTTTSSGSIVRFSTRDDSVIGYGATTSNHGDESEEEEEDRTEIMVFPPRTSRSLFQKFFLCWFVWGDCCGDVNEVEQESKEWIVYWKKFQHEVSVWDLGGIRYNASGNSRERTACPICKEISW